MLCHESEESLRAAVLDLLQNDEKRVRLGHAARQYVIGRYSLSQVVEKEIELLRQIKKDFSAHGVPK